MPAITSLAIQSGAFPGYYIFPIMIPAHRACTRAQLSAIETIWDNVETETITSLSFIPVLPNNIFNTMSFILDFCLSIFAYLNSSSNNNQRKCINFTQISVIYSWFQYLWMSLNLKALFMRAIQDLIRVLSPYIPTLACLNGQFCLHLRRVAQ